MSWFIVAWGEETPSRTHVRDVWHDETGGSALGAPALDSDMRRLLEGSPHQTDFDPQLDAWEGDAALRTPIRSAFSDLRAGNPFMARYLWRVACAGDWRDIEAWVPAPYREAFVHEALRRLWRIYWHKEAVSA